MLSQSNEAKEVVKAFLKENPQMAAELVEMAYRQKNKTVNNDKKRKAKRKAQVAARRRNRK